MPLKLVPPRAGKSPNYTIRGTYLGKRVDRTAGTPDKAAARQALRKIERDIERGAFSDKKGKTFEGAAIVYLNAGGDDRFIKPLQDHFSGWLLSDIDQDAIDEAATKLYPAADNATRNRQVYTPMSAILKRGGHDFRIKRPKGGSGKIKTTWLWPEQFEAVRSKAGEIDVEFGVFLVLLCYTGLRLEEALELGVDMVRLQENYAYIPDTKTGVPRPVYLPPVVVAALASHPRGMDRPGCFVFRYHKSGALYAKLRKVFKAAKVPLGPRDGFHIFRHTFGTWMTRYAGMDAKQLRDTKVWKDIKSAARYSHSVVSEEAQKAALLPVPERGSRGKSVETKAKEG